MEHLTEEQRDSINRLCDMIESCFAYGGAEVGRYNYERYILPYKTELGEELFNMCYGSRYQYLKANATVKTGTYTDTEGCCYNTLIIN